MSKTPKAFDAAVKMILTYKPPKDGEERPESEDIPDETETTAKGEGRRFSKRRKSTLRGVGRVRLLMRRRRARKALAR